jgi:hypothetical protein
VKSTHPLTREQARKTSIAPPPEFDVPYTGKLIIWRTRSELLVGERGSEVPGTVVPQYPDWVKQKQWEYAARQAQAASESLVPTDSQLRASLALRDQPGAYYEPWQPWLRDQASKDWPTDFINAQLEDSRGTMAQNQKVKRGPKVGTHHTEEHRANIDAAKLIKRLQMNALGQHEHEMTPGQIRSAEILLRKSLPDLVQAEITDDSPIAMSSRHQRN